MLTKDAEQKDIRLSFDQIRFQYDPYPIGATKDILPQEVYDEFLNQWPPAELYSDDLTSYGGIKLALSESQNSKQYFEWVNAHPIWRSFYDTVKGKELVHQILTVLSDHHVDLGLLKKRQWEALSARFEFAMLPADGGGILPHTDAPGKLVTLVIMMRDKDWDPAVGGESVVLKPKDMTKNFNHVNTYLSFDDVVPIRSSAFEANQGVLFVKTFNSLHAVYPMRGKGSKAMRKTLTLNILEPTRGLPYWDGKNAKERRAKPEDEPGWTSRVGRLFRNPFST